MCAPRKDESVRRQPVRKEENETGRRAGTFVLEEGSRGQVSDLLVRTRQEAQNRF